MNLQLNGKLAVVSGSTAGIGLAIAKALAREGASVVVNGRTQERVDGAIEQIKSTIAESNVKGIAADLGTAAGIAAFIEAVPSVDILINNLGIFEPKPFEDIDDADWMKFFEVNVLSGVRLSRAYLPSMKAKNWGRIIFVSSESAVQTPSEMIHYGMTKTAQLAVSRGLAESLAHTGVTVNSILPGPTMSEGAETFISQIAEQQGISEAAMEEEFFKTARPSSLIKRFLTTEEIANMAVYLSSPLSSGTTGAALRVDGGVIQYIV